MKIMVIGGGGREHAIIKKLKTSPLCEKIYALPGNKHGCRVRRHIGRGR